LSKEGDTHKRMVQKSLYRTISRNLIRQLCEDGFELVEAVDFINEMLGEVIELGLSNCSAPAKPTAERKEKVEGRSSTSGDAEILASEGKVDIDDRAYLRPLEESDCATLRTWQADGAIAASLAQQQLRRLLASGHDWDSQREFRDLFVMCRTGDDEVVGMLGFTDVDRQSKQAEFSKMIGDPSERGKGHARVATRTVIDYGFDVLGLNRIYLHTLDGNIKNIRLNQSLGFKFEGLLQQAVQIDDKLRDVAIMALLKSQRPPSEPSK